MNAQYAIRIQMMAGPQNGLQTTLTQNRITFGRAAENTLPLNTPDVQHLSRVHGEVVIDNNQWYLVVHSANGATINGRKPKGNKPVLLQPGDVIGVGKQALFAVQFTPMSPAAPTPTEGGPAAEAQAQGQAVGTGINKRAKLWMGIGGYMFVMLAVLIVILSAGGREKNGGGAGPLLPLTNAEIEAEIRQPYSFGADEREAQEYLKKAQTHFNRRFDDPPNLYYTVDYYKRYRAYIGPVNVYDDHLKFSRAEKELIDKVTREYTRAIGLVESQKWPMARAAFRDFRASYPAGPDSKILENVTRFVNHVNRY